MYFLCFIGKVQGIFREIYFLFKTLIFSTKALNFPLEIQHLNGKYKTQKNYRRFI